MVMGIPGTPALNLTSPNAPGLFKPPKEPEGGWDPLAHGNPRDPFARYAMALATPTYGSLGTAAQGYWGSLDPQKVYSTVTEPLANNRGAIGGVRQFMQNPSTFNRVYQAYLNQEGANISSGRPATMSFYDYARTYDYGADYYNQSPRERGFNLGGGPNTSRYLRSFG